jgi:putative endonuclease
MARARRGENLVADWYRNEGWTVVARNWRCTRGELDVVCERNGVLVVCEVKTRRNADFGHPFESVDARKVQRLRRAVAAYLDARRSAGESVPARVQFDVAAVIGDAVDVRRDVGNSM